MFTDLLEAFRSRLAATVMASKNGAKQHHIRRGEWSGWVNESSSVRTSARKQLLIGRCKKPEQGRSFHSPFLCHMKEKNRKSWVSLNVVKSRIKPGSRRLSWDSDEKDDRRRTSCWWLVNRRSLSSDCVMNPTSRPSFHQEYQVTVYIPTALSFI